MENHLFEGIFSPILAANGSQFTPLKLSTDNLAKPPPAKTATPAEGEALPRYLHGDFIKQIWDTEANGENVANDPARMAAVGDRGKARGMYQMHDSYVQTANEQLERKRRVEAQEWADKNAPGWKNQKSADHKKYQEFLSKLPPAKQYKSEDRMDYAKQTEIYQVMMPWSIDNFKRRFKREPNETEMAMLHNVGGQMSLFGNADNLTYGRKFESFKPKKK
jgi:hypothetical protein